MSFASDLRRFSKTTKQNVDEVQRAVGIALFSAVIMDTPVDSGRLRGNWQASRNAPVSITTSRRDVTGRTTIGAVKASIGDSKATDVLYLTNNLPYAQRIEYDGWSHTKAPEGMVRKNVARFRAILAQEARRIKK